MQGTNQTQEFGVVTKARTKEDRCDRAYCRAEYEVICPHGKFCGPEYAEHLDALEMEARIALGMVIL